MIQFNRNLCRLAWFIPVIMLSACGMGDNFQANVIPLAPDGMVIFATMTRNYYGTHSVLNIYVDTDGFYPAHNSTPSSGQEDTGLTVSLWLMIVDHPETYRSFQVKTGQTMSFEGFEIKIIRIGEGKQHFVEVEVNESE
ncbi:MAG: hypothetical protein JW748_04735 [Anaerolineales bacterium]|nr:hypothetical protein [Anaerolineales bacterium]